jgi:TRAP transporter 4TM/12TM fusion protein
MGASVFIMMEILGKSYAAIALAAIIPALLYYVSIFWMVDLEAIKENLRGLPPDQVPRLVDVLKKGWYLLIPIGVLVYMLVIVQVSPLRAGLWGIVSTIILSALKKKSRLGPHKIVMALYTAMRGSVMVMAACSVAGMIVGVLGLTGLGLNMANIIISYSQGILPLTLILAMVVTMILGIGMPTTGSYIISATIIAPALIELGVVPMAAHLFVLYFANMSNITPPVALAGYAAGGISGSNPIEVGVKAFKLGLAGILVPFGWVYGPELIMQGEPMHIIFAMITALVGILALGSALQGRILRKPLHWVSRILMALAAVMLVLPETLTDAVAAGVIIVGLLLSRNKKDSLAEAKVAASVSEET